MTKNPTTKTTPAGQNSEHTKDPDEELAELRALIKKSDLVKVASYKKKRDSCRTPALVPSGVILRHRGHDAEMEQRTRNLQALAAKVRENSVLKIHRDELLAALAGLCPTSRNPAEGCFCAPCHDVRDFGHESRCLKVRAAIAKVTGGAE